MTAQQNGIETASDPDGSIFLPENASLEEINRMYYELWLARGSARALSPEAREERMAVVSELRNRLKAHNELTISA